MDITKKDIEKIGVLLIITTLAILAFILIKPILLSIITGLILAYALMPLHKRILRRIKNKNASAAIVSLLTIFILAVPIYFIAPLMIKQVFSIFEFSQTLDIPHFIKIVFPAASDQFIIQITNSINTLVSKLSSSILNSFANLLLEIPTIMFHLVIVSFVFFYTLRDVDKLKEFVSDLSPLNRIQERKLVQKYKEITNSIVYGQVLIGIIQGLMAGIGFVIFGIPNVLVLTVLAITFSVIPILGPFFVWVPIAIYLISTETMFITVLFVLYNLVIVSNIDNILRLYLVAKKAHLSQVIVLIGMIGGLFIFGLLGLVLGPLILTYFILFLEAYRKDELSSVFKAS